MMFFHSHAQGYDIASTDVLMVDVLRGSFSVNPLERTSNDEVLKSDSREHSLVVENHTGIPNFLWMKRGREADAEHRSVISQSKGLAVMIHHDLI